jgi:hypothetical protein
VFLRATFHFIDSAVSFSSMDTVGFGAGLAMGRGAIADGALIESAMRFAFVSTLSTLTLTIWPVLTDSEGSLI